MMRQDKFDHALSEALHGVQCSVSEGAESRIPVMILTLAEPSAGQWSLLKRMGVTAVRPRGCVYSADLTPQALAELAEQPWVRQLELARTLRRMPTVARGLRHMVGMPRA